MLEHSGGKVPIFWCRNMVQKFSGAGKQYGGRGKTAPPSPCSSVPSDDCWCNRLMHSQICKKLQICKICKVLSTKRWHQTHDWISCEWNPQFETIDKVGTRMTLLGRMLEVANMWIVGVGWRRMVGSRWERGDGRKDKGWLMWQWRTFASFVLQWILIDSFFGGGRPANLLFLSRHRLLDRIEISKGGGSHERTGGWILEQGSRGPLTNPAKRLVTGGFTGTPVHCLSSISQFRGPTGNIRGHMGNIGGLTGMHRALQCTGCLQNHNIRGSWATFGGLTGPCVRHCKNTCCLQYRAKLLPLAGPPSPPMMDARGVRRQERGKYLSQMTLDKQKALNSVGHSCTIWQGMLRRKADRRGEERSVELTNLQISGDFQPTDPPTPTLLHCLLKLSCIPPISCW